MDKREAEAVLRRDLANGWITNGDTKDAITAILAALGPGEGEQDQGSSVAGALTHVADATATEAPGSAGQAPAAAAPRPLTAEMRGEISTALIELTRPEQDEDFAAIHAAQRRIERAVEGAAHPWPDAPREAAGPIGECVPQDELTNYLVERNKCKAAQEAQHPASPTVEKLTGEPAFRNIYGDTMVTMSAALRDEAADALTTSNRRIEELTAQLRTADGFDRQSVFANLDSLTECLETSEAARLRAEGERDALSVSLTWIEWPFVDDSTSADELRRRVKLAQADMGRALTNGEEGR